MAELSPRPRLLGLATLSSPTRLPAVRDTHTGARSRNVSTGTFPFPVQHRAGPGSRRHPQAFIGRLGRLRAARASVWGEVTAVRLYHSNRMEVLAAELARLMREDPSEPSAPERVVIHHPTIGRWLSLELARILDIAANIRFEQPAKFAWSIMRGAAADLSREQAYTPARLRWRIHDTLPEFAKGRWGHALRDYLADGDPRKRFELADRLAWVFDRCLLYRPDWIREWERGATPHWQARLWQRLVAAAQPADHWVAAIDTFKAARAASSPRGDRPSGWPRRASFFAVPALSPSYLDMLCTASRDIEIHVFLLNPCREYWGDIHSRREIRRRSEGCDPAQGYFTEGNELLAAWGRTGRDTFDSFIDIADAGVEEHFRRPAEAHRLAAVQRDILELRLVAAAATAEETPKADVAASNADDSIQVHVCHSPVREAEVLHDRLLALFDSHSDLEPADALILTPDLEVYGPTIEAVFGAAGRIPFRVAQARITVSRTLRGFLDLLTLPGSRLGVETVLAPLDAPAVRIRFGIDATDLSPIRARIRAAGIHWGADEAHRRAEGLPAAADHTWQQGLRRLLLGYAMSDAAVLVAGLTPCPTDATEARGATVEDEVFGRFLTYCQAVFDLHTRLTGERRPADWAGVLRQEIARFFADGSTPATFARGGAALAREIADEVGALRDLIREFEQETAQGEAPVPFVLVRDIVRARATEVSGGYARLADGVTISRLAAGCIFPAQVVCVAGLNDGAFPRSRPAPSFDVVAAGPVRRGDRDIRHEDRFTFLEALLAARRCFLVSYTGRSSRDDVPVPPSVLVDEFTDYLGRRFPGASVETRHPLQPFSPRYFVAPTTARSGGASAGTPDGSGEELFSYSRGMCEAARTLLAGGPASGSLTRFTDVVLPEPDEARRSVELAELIDFFANPTRYFLREYLGARLETNNPTLDEDEPFNLNHLERYRLRADMWDQRRAGVEPERAAALLRGSGRLPQERLGYVAQESAREEVRQLEDRLAPHTETLNAPPCEIDFELDGFRIVGTVGQVGADGLVWWRMGRLRARDRIEIWLRQLAWAAAGHVPVKAVGISLEGRVGKQTDFRPPEQAGEQLKRWLHVWWRGLSVPLAFFPETSLAYAQKIASAPGDGNAAMQAARNTWHGRRQTPDEHLDPYIALVHDGDDPLGDVFEDIAIELLVPLVGKSK